MNIVSVCNIVAWILCAVVGSLLFGDFIVTEIHLADRRNKEVKSEGKE